QLNFGKVGTADMYDELRWLAERPFVDGRRLAPPAIAPNFQGAKEFPHWEDFYEDWRGGILGPYLRWWAAGHVKAFPQLPLFLLACIAVVVAGVRRDWPLAA